MNKHETVHQSTHQVSSAIKLIQDLECNRNSYTHHGAVYGGLSNQTVCVRQILDRVRDKANSEILSALYLTKDPPWNPAKQMQLLQAKV